MSQSIIAIETERLHILPFSAVDADEAFAAITLTLTRYMEFEPPASQSAFESIWQVWLSTIADGSDLIFVIRHREGRGFVGLVGLHDAQSPNPELGIWVREPEQGRGYGSEAVRAVASWGAAALSPRAFRYPVAEVNYASRRIAEGLGGRVIGHKMTSKFALVIYRVPVDRL